MLRWFIMNLNLNGDLRQSITSWVTVFGAVALIIAAIVLAFTNGREGVIADFLLNAGLFLGIQKFSSVASDRITQKYSNPQSPEVNVDIAVDATTPCPPTDPIQGPPIEK